ncbi:hypothetical protein IRJ41_000167 [Triplophysa rosa]|uniref:Uncharacterized protein n=1 Tax=Triplophysa rosa TaxID=992332 RepID=A0A9W8C5X1_TRIRA|nr:hypothetical protein IRJ41_000167 [Triplophysa rosa]
MLSAGFLDELHLDSGGRSMSLNSLAGAKIITLSLLPGFCRLLFSLFAGNAREYVQISDYKECYRESAFHHQTGANRLKLAQWSGSASCVLQHQIPGDNYCTSCVPAWRCLQLLQDL